MPSPGQPRLPSTDRRRAIQILAAQRKPELIRELPPLFDEAPLRIDAIRAIAAFDDEGLGKLLVSRFSSLDNTEKAEAAQTFASRGRYGRMLTDALAANEIDKRDIPPYVARQLRRVVGVRFAEVWGPLEADASEERAYARYRGVLNDNAMAGANAVTGRGVFQRTCAPCHRMFGEGGAIGPELTGSNRANLEYLLSNVLSPNAEIQDAYKVVVITTRDGRTLLRQSRSGERPAGHAAARRARPDRDQQGRHSVSRNDSDVDDADGPVRRAFRTRGHRSRRLSANNGTGQGAATTMRPPSFLTIALAAALLCGSAATLIPAAQAPALGFSFTNVAREAGLTAPTVYGGRDVNTYLLETTGTGVAAIDYDNDGWMDVYLVNGSGARRLSCG